MKLRHKFFIVLALFSSVPLLVLLFGVVEQMEREVTARTNTEMHGTLDKMAGEINLILNNQKALANGLARVPAVRQFATAAMNRTPSAPQASYLRLADQLEQFFLNYQHSVPSIQALRFIGADGKTLVKVKEGKPIEAFHIDDRTGRLFVADQSNRRFFKDALKEGSNVVMSDFELGQVSQDADFCPAMVRYSVPIKDEVDNLEGVLVVNMWGTRLDNTIEAALGGYPANAYIVELDKQGLRDGIYLYHRDSKMRFANQVGSDFKFSNTVLESEWNKIHATSNYGSLFRDDGRMLFYRKISPYPDRSNQWLLVIEADSDTVYASINKVRHSIWMLLTILLFVSILVAVWASGRLTAPIHRLAEIIHHYADGDRKAHFEESITSRDEVSQAGRAFNYLVEKLETTEKEREQAVHAACQSERLAALGQLAAGIGHEINNPLMNIMSLANLIDETLDDDKSSIKNDLEILKKEGQRCARIVQGILSFAREKKPSYIDFDMTMLLTETIELLRHRFESSEIELETKIADTLPMQGDPNLLQQVLVNVLLNAIQASPAGSKILIKAEQIDELIEIEIIDYGIGVSSNDFSKIFDPFFTTKEEGEGTGLGLSISYGIVQRHNGSLSLENASHGGVKVRICLPQGSKINEDAQQMLEEMNVG
jgi:two-component system NtrC family sensor kinase